MCQDEKTLLYIANLGCIELNPWNSRTPTFDRPDYLVIDLDPQEVPFPEVVRGRAETVRKVFGARRSRVLGCKIAASRGLYASMSCSPRSTTMTSVHWRDRGPYRECALPATTAP
ncbi:MAG: hypothetical protein U0793_16555 [Gemmataceae bacterium]